MTKKEILEKAIQKAMDNGWLKLKYNAVLGRTLDNTRKGEGFYLSVCGRSRVFRTNSINELIFNHKFAKALWGEEEVHYYDLVNLEKGGETTIVNKPVWQYHLQQMVIAEDPIKYLRDTL